MGLGGDEVGRSAYLDPGGSSGGAWRGVGFHHAPPLHSGGILGASLLPPDLGEFHHTQHMTEFCPIEGCAPRVCFEGVL